MGEELKPKKSVGHGVGSILKDRRTELDLSISQVEAATQIRKHYITLIEAGDWKNLPDDVYALGYIKSYADYLDFETTPIINMYKSERRVQKSQYPSMQDESKRDQIRLKPLGGQNFVLSTKSVIIILATLLFVGILGYIGFQLALLSAPPKLTLNDTQTTSTLNYVIISGETNTDSDVSINGSPILTNADGSFSERVTLIDGANQITITAKNRLGKTTTLNKSVTANLKAEDQESTDVSATPIDGVEMQVSIVEQATFVTISADGQDVFRGTMLPGTKQKFTAKTSMTLTTSNAGSTQVIITNAVVAAKDLGKLGKPGETKNDLQFSKDTQFE